MNENTATDNVAMAVDNPPMPKQGRKNTIFSNETLATLMLNPDQWYRVFQYIGPDYIKMMSSLNSSAAYWRSKYLAQGYALECQSRRDRDEKSATLYAKLTPIPGGLTIEHQEDVL
nr:hypothetical protein [uncultured Mediterranean phage uvMED]